MSTAGDSQILDAIEERYAIAVNNCIRDPANRERWLGDFACDVSDWLAKRKPAPKRKWWQR